MLSQVLSSAANACKLVHEATLSRMVSEQCWLSASLACTVMGLPVFMPLKAGQILLLHLDIVYL